VDREGWFVRNFLLSEGMNRLELVAEDEFGQRTSLVHDVEMSPSKPSPTSPPTSRVPFMIGLTLLVLLVEGIALELWWWKRRSKA
jgi:hypothetical protein